MASHTRHLSLRYALEAVKLQFVLRIPYVKTIFALPFNIWSYPPHTDHISILGLGVATGDSFLQAFLIADKCVLESPSNQSLLINRTDRNVLYI